MFSCGDDAASEPSDDATQDSSETYPDLDGELQIYTWWVAPGEADAFSSITDIFHERYPKVAISLETDSAAIDDQITNQGIFPDIYQYGRGRISTWLSYEGDSNDNRLVALDDLWEEEGWNALYPQEIVDFFTEEDGHKYTVPVGMHRINSLIYNTAFVSEPPTSIEELLFIAEDLQSRGIVPIAVSDNSMVFDLLLHGVVAGVAGGDWYHKLNQSEIDFDDTEQTAPLREAFERYVELVPYMAPRPDDTEEDGETWQYAIEMVAEGTAAMTIHGDWAKAYMTTIGKTPGVDFMSVASPGTDEVFRYTIDGFYQFKDGPNQENATQFLRLLGSAEGQGAFCKKKGSTPVNPEVDENPDSWDAIANATRAHLQNADYLIYYLDYSGPSFGSIGSQLYDQSITVDEAMQQLVRE